MLVYCFWTKLVDINEERMRKTFDVNVFGCVWTLQPYLKNMIQQNKGHIVVISSGTAHFALADGAAYSSSKFAARGLVQALNDELVQVHAEQVVTTLICPYFVKTPMIGHLTPVSSHIPLLSIDECADDIVDAILYERGETFIPSSMHGLPSLMGVLRMWISTCGANGIRLLRKYFLVKFVKQDMNGKSHDLK